MHGQQNVKIICICLQMYLQNYNEQLNTQILHRVNYFANPMKCQMRRVKRLDLPRSKYI